MYFNDTLKIGLSLILTIVLSMMLLLVQDLLLWLAIKICTDQIGKLQKTKLKLKIARYNQDGLIFKNNKIKYG